MTQLNLKLTLGTGNNAEKGDKDQEESSDLCQNNYVPVMTH